MFDMVLTNKLESGKSWSEATPADGFRGDGTQTYSADAGARTIVIKINWLDLAEAIAYLVGYSNCLSTLTNLPYNPGDARAQGPYYLSRETPARLPAMPNLRCTRVLSVQGRGPNKDVDEDVGGAQPAISGGGVQVGTYGDFEFAFLTLQFEVPKYPILEDEDMGNCATATAVISRGSVNGTLITNGGSGYTSAPTVTFSSPEGGITATATATIIAGAVRTINLINSGEGYDAAPTITISPSSSPEYLRNCWFNHEITLETLARPGETWYFCQPGLGQQTFPGDRLLRVPKTLLKICWYNVHEDYILLGRLFASSFEHRLGCVNSRPFPLVAYRDQNKATGTLVQKQAGEGLLMPPKITPSAMVHPAVLAGEIGPSVFPRNVDVEINILCFSPASIDPTTIDLSGTDHFGFPLNGSSTTLVRGHNLQPLVLPITVPPPWNSTKTYVITDLVTSGGRVYNCILGNRNQAPPNGAYWTDVGPAKFWTWFAGSKGSNLYTSLAIPFGDGGAGFATPPTSNQQQLLTLIQQNAPRAQIYAMAALVYPTAIPPFGTPTGVQEAGVTNIRNALNLAIGQTPVNSDEQLLYPYGDFEALWASCESQTP